MGMAGRSLADQLQYFFLALLPFLEPLCGVLRNDGFQFIIRHRQSSSQSPLQEPLSGACSHAFCRCISICQNCQPSVCSCMCCPSHDRLCCLYRTFCFAVGLWIFWAGCTVLKPHSVANSVKAVLANWGPLSVKTVLGTPYRANCARSLLISCGRE